MKLDYFEQLRHEQPNDLRLKTHKMRGAQKNPGTVWNKEANGSSKQKIQQLRYKIASIRFKTFHRDLFYLISSMYQIFLASNFSGESKKYSSSALTSMHIFGSLGPPVLVAPIRWIMLKE